MAKQNQQPANRPIGRGDHFRAGTSSADRQHRPAVPTAALYQGSGIPADLSIKPGNEAPRSVPDVRAG